MSGYYWSHSALKAIKVCPRKWEQEKLLKNFKSDSWQNRQADAGTTIHEALENNIKSGTKLPKKFAKDKGISAVSQIATRNRQGLRVATATHPTIEAEAELGITWGWEPCGFWEKKNGMFRGKLDLLMLTPTAAYIGDYKTGNPRYGDPMQLERNAILVFASAPSVQLVKTQLLWTQTGKADTYFYRRSESIKPRQKIRTLPAMLEQLEYDIDHAEGLLKSGDFQAKPNGLCFKYCPVETCERHGEKHYG